jgi:nicotinamidase/pyrazinamidase
MNTSKNMNTEKEIIEAYIKNSVVASFDVDPQKGFTPVCPNELPVPEGNLIVSELNSMAKMASVRVASKDAHSPNAIWVATSETPQFSPVVGDHPDMDIHWTSHCVVGTEGFEFIDGLPKPEEYNFVVYKGIERHMHPYGACYHDLANTMSTGVIEFLRSKNVEVVIVGGLATDYCVKTTAIQLKNAGFVVIVNLAACRHISEDSLNSAVIEMKSESIFVIDRL